MNKLDLTVIVLSYNTKDITDQCLTKLKAATLFCQKKINNKINVIVVDNASADDSWQMLKAKHSWTKLIKSEVNTGFSGGNNLAMKDSLTPFILLLNSDAYVKEDTLFDSLQFFDDNPDCDVLGCRLLFANNRFQPSAGFLPTPTNTWLWISGLSLLPGLDQHPYHPRNPNFFSKVRPVEWVMGAFMMLKKEVYQKTQGFDESIFMYGEEIEWCKRIKDLGFKTYYVPEFQITHLDKASSNFMIEKPLLNEFKGIARYFNKHYKSQYPQVKLVIQLSLILRVIIFTLLINSQRRRAYFEALKVL